MEKIQRHHQNLSRHDKCEVFRLATRGFASRYQNRFAEGMDDNELENALKNSLGIFGGSGSPNRLSITYQSAGLKIWGGWNIVNHVIEKPLFQGNATIAMAREVYSITNPQSEQLSLL